MEEEARREEARRGAWRARRRLVNAGDNRGVKLMRLLLCARALLLLLVMNQ